MDRNGHGGTQQRRRLRRSLGVHVPRAERRAPSGHRQQRGVDGCEVGHPGEDVGVPGEVHGRPAADDEAERRSARSSAGPAAVVVLGGCRLYPQPGHLRCLAGHELVDALDAGGPQERCGAGRGKHADVVRQHFQRRQVEMVVVEVREQHRIHVARHRGRRSVTPQVRDPRPQDRVGEQADATVLDEHGGVSEPGDPRGRA